MHDIKNVCISDLNTTYNTIFHNSIMYYSRSIMRYTSIQLCKYTCSSKITFRGRSKNSLGFYSNIAYFATNVGIKKSLLSLFSVGVVLPHFMHKR